jgi:hypothetical protein
MVYDTPILVANLKKSNTIACKMYTRCFLVLNVSNINISDNKVHKFVVNSVDLNKYNQRFQVYFWIFRLTLTCHVSTNQSAPGVAILDMQMSKVPIISGYEAFLES